MTQTTALAGAAPLDAIEVRARGTVRVGDTFSDWTVIAIVVGADRRRKCLVRCVCGSERRIGAARLITGGAQRCRTCALRALNATRGPRERLSPGEVRNDWTVVSVEGAKCRVRCVCGREGARWMRDLLSGRTKRCLPCTDHRRNAAHSQSGSALHRIWVAMNGRCHCKSDTGYERYGARGISVCAGWRSSGRSGRHNGSFERFMADMGPRPTPEHSIDRIDNDKGYWCGRCDECRALGRQPNCRWATREVQARNKRTTRMLTLGGRTQCAEDWGRELGIPPMTIRHRLDIGMTAEEALAYDRYPAGRSKLTAAKVAELRKRHANGASVATLAAEVGMAKHSVARAVRGETWVCVPLPDTNSAA